MYSVKPEHSVVPAARPDSGFHSMIEVQSWETAFNRNCIGDTPSVYLEEVKQGGHLAMEIIPQLRPGFAFPTH
ncbi:hypothetical protein RRG08_040080 [Elysia crispata]|uniref:Uncharacterized protein n=1 Tax=Elysia crispata TaxID=231223 RepID=A0AAE0XXC4_9GAST|nr:hypothetical protein RRG08_040080 [Elysia crispata]